MRLMPAEYQIDRSKGLVLSRAWGRIGKQDMIDHGNRLLADPAFQPDLRQLWDLTEITESSLDFADLTSMSQVNVFAPASRRAVLAPADVAFGMARSFQMLRETKGESGIRVFRERSEALRWLETGVDPAPPPRGSSPP